MACRDRMVSSKSFNFSYEMIKFGMSITPYCIKINLIYELNILQDSCFFSASLVRPHQQKRDHKREGFCCFCLGLNVIPFFTLSEMLSTIALGCRCGSSSATLSPSSPVIGPDGCKAALLQNMSRAGEEEVGVESGKGQRPKPSPYTSSLSHTL